MISCVTLLLKRPELSQKEFHSRWEREHGPLYLAVPGLSGYEQNAVFLKEKGDASSELVRADGFSIERYETLHEYNKAVGSREYRALEEDRRSFAGRVESYVCLENVSIPYAGTGTVRKKISLLGRTESRVSFEDFTREWLVIHSGCMAKMPRDIFFGYNQHLVIYRYIDGVHAPYEALPTDGLLELYYSESEAVAKAFATTAEGRMTVSHRKEFMSRVDPFQVNYVKFK